MILTEHELREKIHCELLEEWEFTVGSKPRLSLSAKMNRDIGMYRPSPQYNSYLMEIVK